MTDAEVALQRLIDEVVTGQSWAAHKVLTQWVQETGEALAAGDASAAGPALTYLEADPYYFRSGYARNWLAGRLSYTELAGPELYRARGLVLAGVDGRCHCGQHGLGRLARSVADNDLRRQLKARLHEPDSAISRRALKTLVDVRHPGLTAADVKTARLIVLDDAGQGLFLMPSVERLARWLWNPEWHSELQETARHRGAHRGAAKRLIEHAERRTMRRQDRR